jgi:hypothetical protein
MDVIDFSELEFMVESLDDTRITLTVTSPSGQKISLTEFTAVLQGWLDEVHKADIMRAEGNLENH